MSIFGSVYAGAYDWLYAGKDYAGECGMIEEFAAEFGALHPIRRVLDLGCGTGGHALALAARGYSVTGVDAAPAMIALARQKAASQSVCGPTFYDEDICRLRLDDPPYDAALMMFAVLGYQHSDRKVRAAMRTARAHLVVGAVLVFDIWYGPGVLAAGPEPRCRAVETPAGRIVRRAESVLDAARRRCTVDYRLERWYAGALQAVVEERHLMRFFFPQELKQFAADSGFACCTMRRLPDWRLPADPASWSAVCVYRAV